MGAKKYEFDVDIGFNKDINNKHLKLKYDNDEEKVTYEVVESDGMKVAFMGLYLDLRTGYFLLGNEKRTTYVPVFDFYSIIDEEYNGVNKDQFIRLLEDYKLSKVERIPIIFRDLEYNYQPEEKSLIGAILDKAVDQGDEDEEFKGEYFFESITEMKQSLNDIKQLLLEIILRKGLDVSYAEGDMHFKKFLTESAEYLISYAGISLLDNGEGIEFENNYIILGPEKEYRENYRNQNSTSLEFNNNSRENDTINWYDIMNIYDLAEEIGRDTGLDYGIQTGHSGVVKYALEAVFDNIDIEETKKFKDIDMVKSKIMNNRDVIEGWRRVGGYKKTVSYKEYGYHSNFDSEMRLVNKSLDRLDDMLEG